MNVRNERLVCVRDEESNIYGMRILYIGSEVSAWWCVVLKEVCGGNSQFVGHKNYFK